METKKKREGRGHLKRWMQALALVYVLMFLPVRGVQEAESTGADSGSVRADAYTDSSSSEEAENTGEQQKPRIALTFDDGPSAVYTPVLLDGLKERGVKATFFLVGENIVKDGNQRIVRRMYEEGHLIGNHTYHHVDLSALMERLGAAEIDSVLLEGGGTLNWAALESGIVQRVQAYIAPKLFGGRDAKSPVAGLGVELPAQAVGLKNITVTPIGEDFLLESEVDTDVHRNR